MKEKVMLYAFQKLDFETNDKTKIKGIKLYYTSNVTDESSEFDRDMWGAVKASEEFISLDDYSTILNKLKTKKLPYMVELKYEIVSTKRPPKVVSLDII